MMNSQAETTINQDSFANARTIPTPIVNAVAIYTINKVVPGRLENNELQQLQRSFKSNANRIFLYARIPFLPHIEQFIST
ncbi:MAG: hypothetical protein ACFHVJ_05215 [Aestuariibacter sp.]